MEDSRLDGMEKGSPGLKPFNPKIQPSPSPPPDTPSPKHAPSTTANHEDHRPRRASATEGDAKLIESLTGGDLEMIRLAGEKGLPPDQDDKDKPQVEDASLPRSQPPQSLKRLSDGVLKQLGIGGSQIGRSTRQKIVHQSDNGTGGGYPNERLLTIFSEAHPPVIYDDSPPPGEASGVTQESTSPRKELSS
ncbi:hypothetical protein CEP54_016120 [Fusarium duplospermum]|uniref:Uncharacterized protein n=1 Tax=Fusarium duplospermum TaxID=1325734 RepID=A0A428NI76_9HYPO|nr:hypothetical protein CEP54_016120 [Fusarium duplospermum]